MSLLYNMFFMSVRYLFAQISVWTTFPKDREKEPPKQRYLFPQNRINLPVYILPTQISRIRQAETNESWPVESLIKNHETMKSYKITGKNNIISIFLIKKGSFIRVFI